VAPYLPDAVCWDGDGACIRAADEIKASRQAQHLARKAITLIASAMRGSKEYPYVDGVHLWDDPKTTQLTAVSVLRSAANVVQVAHLVVGPRFDPGWWKPILKQAKETR
jgi:hypothetical protein